VSFSEALIVHKFRNADGTPASGAVQFTLEKRITQAATGETIVPSAITSNLNDSGELSQKLLSTEDAGTIPTDSRWRVDLRLLGDQEDTWFIKVPTGGGTINLATLLPTQPKGG
jgi:hypothetical protein